MFGFIYTKPQVSNGIQILVIYAVIQRFLNMTVKWDSPVVTELQQAGDPQVKGLNVSPIRICGSCWKPESLSA